MTQPDNTAKALERLKLTVGKLNMSAMLLRRGAMSTDGAAATCEIAKAEIIEALALMGLKLEGRR